VRWSWRRKLGNVRSRERDFQHLGAGRKRHGGRLEPEFQGLSGVAHGFFLRVARGSASGEFREEGGPALGLRIKLQYQPKFHIGQPTPGRQGKQERRDLFSLAWAHPDTARGAPALAAASVLMHRLRGGMSGCALMGMFP